MAGIIGTCKNDVPGSRKQEERKSTKKQQEWPENIKIHTRDVQISVEVLHGTLKSTPG